MSEFTSAFADDFTAPVPPEPEPPEPDGPDYAYDYGDARAQCADCGEPLFVTEEGEGWCDGIGRTTCWYRIDTGHQAVPLGSVPVPTFPASISPASATGGIRRGIDKPSVKARREREHAQALLEVRQGRREDQVGDQG